MLSQRSTLNAGSLGGEQMVRCSLLLNKRSTITQVSALATGPAA